jgi:hypothetical protein
MEEISSLDPYDDLEGWVQDVNAALSALSSVYSTDCDINRRREVAGTMIGIMTLCLQRLGVFGDFSTADPAPTIDVLQMLRDLNRGRRHPWSEPAKVGGSSIETTGDREIRLWSLVAMTVLKQGGHASKAAYILVAGALSAAGVTGRQSPTGQFPYQTVQRWWLSFSKEPGRDEDRVSFASKHFWETADCPHSPIALSCSFSDGEPCMPRSKISEMVLRQDGSLAGVAAGFRSGGFG